VCRITLASARGDLASPSEHIVGGPFWACLYILADRIAASRIIAAAFGPPLKANDLRLTECSLPCNCGTPRFVRRSAKGNVSRRGTCGYLPLAGQGQKPQNGSNQGIR
jgi:hypothetical protein